MSFSLVLSLVTATLAVIVPVSNREVAQGKSQSPSALVNLGYSQYQGISLPGGVNQYLGMRFAAVPTGDLRWRAPVDPPKTNGTQDATAWGNICLGSGKVYNASTTSEDCLHIHVFTPRNATPASKLPVWLFIQGGGYQTNSNQNYNGTKVVMQSNSSIIMVTFNYRVGAWGFLASEKVRAGGDLNAGLLDQRKAMQWVQKYIHLFGGDPAHVVIHGTSAGAGSVATHLTAYGARNDHLFVGAIGESVFMPWQPHVSELEWQFTRFSTSAGCSNATNELTCLRGLSQEFLQPLNKASHFPNGTSSPLFYWTPAIDGDLLRDYPMRMIAAGKIIKVPIMFGDDTDEGSAFAPNASTPADISQFFKNNYPKLTSADTDAINAQYPLMTPISGRAPYYPSAMNAYGEACFTCPGISITQAFTQHSDVCKVWNYRYNGQGKNGSAPILVSHTTESPAVFGTRMVNDAGTSFESYNAPMVSTLMNYWISFIRTLDPNPYKWSEAPMWDAWSTGGNQSRIMFQTNRTAMEVVPPAQLGRCAFWKDLEGTMEI